MAALVRLAAAGIVTAAIAKPKLICIACLLPGE
jgi:hypothetical protein